MSVIVSKRQHSEVEYIHKAQQLIFFLIDRLDKYERKLEKKYIEKKESRFKFELTQEI